MSRLGGFGAIVVRIRIRIARTLFFVTDTFGLIGLKNSENLRLRILMQLGFSSNMERTARQSSGLTFSVLSLERLTKSPVAPQMKLTRL
jgi:hypothetical protein